MGEGGAEGDSTTGAEPPQPPACVQADTLVVCGTSVHGHEAITVPSNAAPLESPQHVELARTILPLRVSIPELGPQMGQYLPGSVAEKRPIWSTMSPAVAVV